MAKFTRFLPQFSEPGLAVLLSRASPLNSSKYVTLSEKENPDEAKGCWTLSIAMEYDYAEIGLKNKWHAGVVIPMIFSSDDIKFTYLMHNVLFLSYFFFLDFSFFTLFSLFCGL